MSSEYKLSKWSLEQPSEQAGLVWVQFPAGVEEKLHRTLALGAHDCTAAVTDQMPYESIFGNYTSEFLCWCSRGQILLHTPGLCQTGFSQSWDIIDSVEVYDFICSNLLWSLTKFNLNLCKSSVQHMNLALKEQPSLGNVKKGLLYPSCFPSCCRPPLVVGTCIR